MSLDEYFVFRLKEKQLGQIIEQDFGLWPEKEDSLNTILADDSTSKNDLFEDL